MMTGLSVERVLERRIAAPPAEVAALLADFDRIWPAQVCPAPKPRSGRTYRAGLMIWEEFDRPGAARAFRVVEPPELEMEHWFQVEPEAGATVLRHTVEGRVASTYETVWRERIFADHDRTVKALFDKVEAAAASGG